ncbi:MULTISPECIES: N-formylglutamate deformylase [unclassified Beijerinckia]|uniref:N-formylglutamate deformylase n=1 Tax=unclassified Beijerinckia TaxID=2638183 RepID=UPI00089BFD4F|nr:MULTISPECIES: N-formylglutamate deformylase [unclassified Beijerinckia]MDH7799088.1 N-formylglutamate deformylase [Beijerinckia sp. GAS462]SED95438.1 formiminoglutamase [Beijerinckia sp. 28-YEA-48]
MQDWLTVNRGKAPLVISLPHTGTELPADYETQLVSPWLARKDADWWIDKLYDFAGELDATIVHTAISRTVIDVNRNPSGDSLYPGQATTELCPTTTFDGERLYKPGQEPTSDEVADRRRRFFEPYHTALENEIARLSNLHGRVVLYDCHSIRSVIPRLFEGELPVFNIGTNSDTSCDPLLAATIENICATSPFSHIANGRFKGGWITRRYGRPQDGVHAVQMELSCRAYMREPSGPVGEDKWPTPFDAVYAAPVRTTLTTILNACLQFAKHP